MSWEPYVQTLVDGGFHHACIAGHNGSIWGSTANFKVLPKEISLLCNLFSNADEDAHNAALATIQEKGFTIQGRAYAMNRYEQGEDEMSFLIGRCKQHGSASRGVCIARTAQTVIIGLHDAIFAEGISFGKSNVALYQLAEQLTSMNF